MNEFQVGQLVWSELQKSEVWVRYIYPPGHSCAGMVMVGDGKIEWGTDLSNLTPLEPRVGDRVRVTRLNPRSSFGRRGGEPGAEYTVEKIRGRVIGEPEFYNIGVQEIDGGTLYMFDCILLRRASTPEVKERKFYGKMPSVLPSTLPAGTKSQGGRVALTDVTLSGIVYRGRWIHEETGVEQEMLSPTCVDWSLVEIQPSPPQPETSGGSAWVPSIGDECEGTVSLLSVTRDGETVVVDRSTLKPISPPPGGSADVPSVSGAEAVTKPSGGGSSKPDPYRKTTIAQCMHRNSSNGHCQDCGGSTSDARANEHPLNFLRWSDEQDKICASRRAKLEQTKKDMDRPVRHPSDFESWDEPTNVWMNGRP